jgi:hypothetical protein
MKSKRIFIIYFLAIAAILFPYFAASSPQTGIQLQVFPKDVVLDKGQKLDVMLVVRNHSAGLMQNLKLQYHARPGVGVELRNPDLDPLPPGGSRSWRVGINRSNDGSGSERVYFQMNYSRKEKNPPFEVPGVVLGALEIKAPLPTSIKDVAELRIQTALDVLQELNKGVVYLVIRNLSNFPIKVTRITPEVPAFVNLHLPDFKTMPAIDPQESQVYHVLVNAGDTVQPGKSIFLFNVGIAWRERGIDREGSLIESHECKIGVLGESDILKVLGIPSFLLLPGFLMVTVFLFLRRRIAAEQEILLEAKSAEFWMIAITLSLISAPLYPRITSLFGAPRDYMTQYGLRDVFQVWIGSVTIGCLASVIYAGVESLIQRIKEKLMRARTFSEQDSPLAILRKLAKLDTDLSRIEYIEVEKSGKKEEGFLIKRAEKELWLVQPIEYTWKMGYDKGYHKKFYDNCNTTDAETLSNLLEEGKKQGSLEFKWKDQQKPIRYIEWDKVKYRHETLNKFVQEKT